MEEFHGARNVTGNLTESVRDAIIDS